MKEMEILQCAETSMVKGMCGVQLNDIKRSKHLLLMSGLDETIVQLAVANNVNCNGHVFRREDVYV